MAKKKRNKKEQTFNVYPYLGGYQHFMRKGGSLPKFVDEGQVDVNTIARRIKPTNKYSYSRDYEGLVREFNDANKDDRVKFGLQGNFLGNTLGLISGAKNYVSDVADVFKKESYTPGGKYSKFDESGALRFGKISLKNTTDRNALLHGENLSRYLSMSNEERDDFIKSGGRNTDLWWTPDELLHGKYNYMDLNEDGTPKFDGIMYQYTKKRNENLVDPNTGEPLFGIKTRRSGLFPGDDGFMFFNPDGTLASAENQQGTIYDQIETGKGTGQLGDVRATSMIFDFDKEGDNKLEGFTSFEQVEASCSDGSSLTEEECTNNGGTWTAGKVDEVYNEYDSEKEYGNYTKTERIIQTEQDRINKKIENEELYEEGGEELNTTSYFNDIDRFNQFGSAFDTEFKFGGSLPKYEDLGETTQGQTVNPDDKEEEEMLIPGVDFDPNANVDNFQIPNSNPYGYSFPNDNTIDIQPEPKADWEEPNNMQKLKNFLSGNSDLNKPPDAVADAQTNEMIESIDSKNNASQNIPVVDATKRDAATEEEQDMGIDVSYGDGPLQSTTNKVREATNTGPLGAALDVVGKTSAFVVDKVIPWIDQGLGMNKRRSDFLHKRSVSAEDVTPMQEETVGTGSRGFYNVNYGGYGDDLYGTGQVYGQVQQGQELNMQQEQMPQADLSGVPNFLNLEDSGLKYKKMYLDKQKEFLGKMEYGGDLEEYSGGGVLKQGVTGGYNLLKKGTKYLFDKTRRVNPLLFKPTDNIFFSTGKYNQPYTKINYSGLSQGDDINAFLNLNTSLTGPSAIEMVSVSPEYRKLGLSTILYDQAIKTSASNQYPGIISGRDLDNPEATIKTWSNFEKLVANDKGEFVENPAFNASEFIVDGKYTGPEVLLRGTLPGGENKIKEINQFLQTMSKEGELFGSGQFDIIRGASGTDFHSPLWRGIRSKFGKTYSIPGVTGSTDQKTFKDYNKIPLYIGAGLGATGLYNTLSGENRTINEEQEKQFRKDYLNRRAQEEGFNTMEEYIQHLNDTNRIMQVEDEIYEQYLDSVENKQLQIHKDGAELSKYLRGGGTATEGAVLCDAYDRPIDPEKAAAADVNNNYRGPGMRFGGQLPKYDDGGNWDLKGWLKGEQGFIPDYKGESTKKTISENESVNKALDYTQTALTVGGMQDYTGPVAAGLDVLNTGISGARAYAAPEGSDQRKKHLENMALNATSAIPGYGLTSATTSLAKDTATYAGVIDDQSVTKTVADSMDTSKPVTNIAEKTDESTGSIGKDKVKFGGEQIADIDMDLYYALMKAGANIKILS